MKPKLQPWIEEGYRSFAYEGPHGLKVERLAKKVSKNKSSFYHHFADLEIFTSVLLKQHLAQAEIIAEKEANCQSLEELIAVLVDHKVDILFNRQLRIHRENTEFERCFTTTNTITIPAFLGIWSQIIDLQDNSYLADLVLRFSMENFFLQITDETLEPEWLRNYFDELQKVIRGIKNTRAVLH